MGVVPLRRYLVNQTLVYKAYDLITFYLGGLLF